MFELKSEIFRINFYGLTRKVFGLKQTGPLYTSEYAAECRFSANLCKRAPDVTADVIVEATCNADILTVNSSEDLQ